MGIAAYIHPLILDEGVSRSETPRGRIHKLKKIICEI